MWRGFFAGVVAIGVLVAGSIAVIVVVTGDERPRGAPPRPAEFARPGGEEPSRPTGLPPPPMTVTYGTVRPQEPVPPVVTGPPPPPPPRDSWEAVPITARAKTLGRTGGLVAARLSELRDELTTCFTYEAQAQRGSGPVSTVRDAAPMDDTGSIVLVLQLEGQQGGLRIVDAPVETRGPAGDELLACAQSVLRGKVLEVPGATPGAKYRLLHTLTP